MKNGAPQLETETARLLRSINAFPKSVEELADLPAELVGRAITYAQAEAGIESVPGWVVEALRRYRDDGWPIPELRTRQIGITSRARPIDIESYTSGAYGDLFRLGSDTSGLGDCFVEHDDGVFGAPSTGVFSPAPAEAPAQEQPLTAPHIAIGEIGAQAQCLVPESADDVLTREVQAELRMRCSRQRGRVIEGLRVHATDDTTLTICATIADLDIVQRELIGALQRILEPLGAPTQLVFTTRAGWEARKRDGGNARSRPDAQQGSLLHTSGI